MQVAGEPECSDNHVDGTLDLPVHRLLEEVGVEHRAQDGLDEISNSAATDVVELKDGQITKYQITPQQFGIKPGELSELIIDSAGQSFDIMLAVLENKPGPALDIVLLNAGATIYVAGLAPNMEQGIELARHAIATGEAKNKLQQLASLTTRLAG